MNVNAQAYANYKKTSVEAASPGRLLLMLYDGAVKDIDMSKKAIENNDMKTAHEQIVKAQNIVLELISTLNMDYEISKSLFSLYEYLHYQLVQANIKKDISMLDEVRSFLLELKETWEEAIKKAAPTRNNTAPPTNQGFNVRG